MSEANFRTFQPYKSQKIMTYSSLVYGLPIHTRQQETYGYYTAHANHRS